MRHTSPMRPFTLERAALAFGALLGLLPGAHTLFTHRVSGGEAGVGLLLTAFCLSQLLRKQE